MVAAGCFDDAGTNDGASGLNTKLGASGFSFELATVVDTDVVAVDSSSLVADSVVVAVDEVGVVVVAAGDGDVVGGDGLVALAGDVAWVVLTAADTCWACGGFLFSLSDSYIAKHIKTD